jgi:Putative adhesin
MIKRLALSIIFAVVSTATVGADTLKETFDRTYDLPAGSTFTLSNVNGRVRVTSWDQPQVRMHAEKSVRTRNADDARKAMAALRIDVTMKPGELKIETRTPKSDDWGILQLLSGSHVETNVDYDIVVPRKMRVVAAETVNGMIEATDLNGGIRLETTNGRIDATRCSGRVDASTTNGGIHAQLSAVDPSSSMTFETTNGAITVELPSSFNARVDAETTNGAVETDFPVTVHGTQKNELHGVIGNGGGAAALKLSTTNGGIHIKRAGSGAASM